MGKQINYWLEHEGFVLLAQKALELGCEIVREDLSKYERTKVTVSRDLDIVTDEDGAYYFFHLPEAGRIEIKITTAANVLTGFSMNVRTQSLRLAILVSSGKKSIYAERGFFFQPAITIKTRCLSTAPAAL